MVESAQTSAGPQPAVDEKAVKEIAGSEFYAFLGEDKIRRIAYASEITGAAELRNDGRWLTPSIRQEVLRILAADLPSISETYAWMVVRRYRELKRWYVEQVMLAEKKRLEDEAKAKLAAEKAAKAAAAKAAKPAEPAKPAAVTESAATDLKGKTPEMAAPKPGDAGSGKAGGTMPAAADAAAASDVNAQVPADQASRTSPPDPHNASPAAATPGKDTPKPS